MCIKPLHLIQMLQCVRESRVMSIMMDFIDAAQQAAGLN